uniref:Cytochrome c oxidase assembly factor 3 mitochondrial coiled-coil domain-containing protein n=2 Tax=Peronosporaceae TaxID=4777 RepID=M4BWR8_HYAAE
MALSVRAKNFILGGGLATFASAIFGYTFHQMGQDDFKDLDTVKVNVHQSGIKPSAVGKHDE